MADNITQARRVVGQFLAQNRGTVQTPGAVQQLVDDVDRLVRGTPVQMGVMPYIQRLEAVGDDDAAIGFARGILRILNRPSQRSAKAAAVIRAAKAVGTPRVKASRASAQLLAIAQDVAKIASDWERFAKEENRKPNWTAYGRFRARWGGWFSDVQTSDRAAEQRITNRVLIDDLIDGIREELPNPAAHIRKLERELKKAAAMVR